MPVKKIYAGKIPFDKDGNQMTYALDGQYHSSYYKPHSWVDNFVFSDTLIYVSYHRGRSAAHFTFKRASNGRDVTFFLSDFDDAMKYCAGGVMKGLFTFKKRGENYGCRMIIDDDESV